MPKPGFIPGEQYPAVAMNQMQKHNIGCLVNHYGSCPGYPHTTEENKNMTEEPWYLDSTRVALTEETYDSYDEDTGMAMPSYRIWTASIDAHLERGPSYNRTYGPQLEMSRSGDTAAEAYSRLVEALEEQGWTVR